jgi:hypothetical protein
MAYSYEAEKPALFTDEGQRMFLRVSVSTQGEVYVGRDS